MMGHLALFALAIATILFIQWEVVLTFIYYILSLLLPVQTLAHLQTSRVHIFFITLLDPITTPLLTTQVTNVLEGVLNITEEYDSHIHSVNTRVCKLVRPSAHL